MSEEVYQGLAGQLEAFQSDADTPKVISEEVIHRELTSAAVKAGIDPAIICAMNKTGMILIGGREDHWSEDDLAEWGRSNRRVRFPKLERAFLKPSSYSPVARPAK